jgi:anti-anti-sigma regulatory factor
MAWFGSSERRAREQRTIMVTRTAAVTVVSLPGVCDDAVAVPIASIIDGELAAFVPPQVIVLDLARTTELDACAAQTLGHWSRTAREFGVDVRLRGGRAGLRNQIPDRSTA